MKIHTAPLTELVDAAKSSVLKGRFTKFYMDPSSSDLSESLEHVDEVMHVSVGVCHLLLTSRLHFPRLRSELTRISIQLH